MHSIEIGGRTIGQGASPYIIAEAGSNHNGDLDMAKRLVDVAASAGADAVKFQTFRAEEVYVKNSGTTTYLDEERSIYEIIEEMEMPYEWIPKLAEYCRSHGVDFLSSATDERSLDIVADHAPALKIPSYTMSHHEFLDYVATFDLPVIMSTGAHSFDEIREAVDQISDAGVADLVVLHCVAAYPAPIDAINVRVIKRIRSEFDVHSGLSDHTLDPTVAPCAATALRSAIIEKHFTLDRSMQGPDHQSSLEPAELNEMITAVRNTWKALGSSGRPVYEIEKELHDVARRRIHATTDISAGETFNRENTGVLRSGERSNGLVPKHYSKILGRTASRDIESGTGITWDHITDS